MVGRSPFPLRYALAWVPGGAGVAAFPVNMSLVDWYKASLMIDIQGWLICLIHRGDHKVGSMLGG